MLAFIQKNILSCPNKVEKMGKLLHLSHHKIDPLLLTKLCNNLLETQRLHRRLACHRPTRRWERCKWLSLLQGRGWVFAVLVMLLYMHWFWSSDELLWPNFLWVMVTFEGWYCPLPGRHQPFDKGSGKRVITLWSDCGVFLVFLWDLS